MKPITPVVPGFDLPVTAYAKDQPEYIPLPCYRGDDGMVVTRWRLTFLERIQVALTGDLWLTVLTFNRALQPVKLDVACPIMGHTGYDPEV